MQLQGGGRFSQLRYIFSHVRLQTLGAADVCAEECVAYRPRFGAMTSPSFSAGAGSTSRGQLHRQEPHWLLAFAAQGDYTHVLTCADLVHVMVLLLVLP